MCDCGPHHPGKQVQPPAAPESDRFLKTLMKPANQAEANVIQSVLAEHGIDAEIKSFHDTAYDGLFQSQYGWGLILVSEADLPEARRIIEAWREATPEDLPWENESTDQA